MAGFSGAYRARWRGWLGRPGVQQGGPGPAGRPSGCRTGPRSHSGSSLAPRTLQHQVYSGPALSPAVREDQAVYQATVCLQGGSESDPLAASSCTRRDNLYGPVH